LSKALRDPGDLTGPVTFLLLLLIALVVIRGIEPPPLSAQQAPVSEFSEAAAMRDVRAIARRPHPLASAEHERVREYIVARLRELGANPGVQTLTVARHTPSGPETWAVVRNVVSRIPGSAADAESAGVPALKSTGAVLMVANYDSVPSGPGAGDDAASVAAILDTIRALKVSRQPRNDLRNDLIVLFTDGEAIGMLGSKGFLETYPALREVKVVLNFDNRGDQGPSMLFQASARDSWLIDHFADAAPFPRGDSVKVALYQRTPGETDLTDFISRGIDGMTFGASGGTVRYKTELDNPDMLDPRTLQHEGTNALSMARRFGSIELRDPRIDDAVFFVAAGSLIHYTSRFALPVAFLVTILVVVGLGIGIREGRFKAAAIGTGAAIYILALALAVLEALGTWRLMAALAAHRMLPCGTTYGGGFYSVAALAIIFGTLWTMYVWIGRFIRAQDLGAGALAFWTGLMLASSFGLPGVSYLFTWPLLFATLALSYRSGATDGDATIRFAILAMVGLVPGTAMLAPAFVTGADGTLLSLAISGLIAALLFGLYIPYMDLLTSGRRWIVPAVSGLLAIVMIIEGNAASAFDASRPRPDSIFYVLDSDRGQATFASLDSQPDVFTAQFFQRHVRAGWLARLTGLATFDASRDTLAKIPAVNNFAYLNEGRTIEGDAPLIKAAAPTIKVLDDASRAGARVVKVHIASARSAPIVWIAVPFGVTVLGSSIDGKSPGDRVTNGWTGWYWNAPASGFDLDLKLASQGPFALTVIDQTEGLPQTPGLSIKPRPAGTMPTPFLFFDSATLVRKTIAIGGEALTKR